MQKVITQVLGSINRDGDTTSELHCVEDQNCSMCCGLVFIQLWREPLVCRVTSFVLLYALVLTFVVVEWSFVVVLYLSSGWFCRS